MSVHESRLPIEVTVRGGTLVRLRLAEPADAPLLDRGFAELSADSRYMRFFSGMARLPEPVREQLVDVDAIDRVAVIALAGDDPVGVARYTRDETNPMRGELAVTVVDRFQRLGLGRVLLTELRLHASTNGISTLAAVSLRSNDAIRRLLTAMGGRVVTHPSGERSTVCVELLTDGSEDATVGSRGLG